MSKIRKLHAFLGVFFTPAIVFFSLSGMLQVFGLHESAPGKPPARPWIVALAQIHKDQRIHAQHARVERRVRAQRAEVTGAPEGPHNADAEKSAVPLKVFVLLMSLGLIVTSLLGLYLATKFSRPRSAILTAIAAGILVPLLLLIKLR